MFTSLEKSRFFLSEKKEWESLLIEKLCSYAADRTNFIKAINAQQIVLSENKRCTVNNPLKGEELDALLKAIREKDNKSPYTLRKDAGFGNLLLDLGFSKVEVSALKNRDRAFVLLLEAMAFDTFSEINQLTDPFYDSMYSDVDNLSYVDDRKNFDRHIREIIKLYLDFYIAMRTLEWVLTDKKNHLLLREKGESLHQAVHLLFIKGKISRQDILKLPMFLNAAAALIDNPGADTAETYGFKLNHVYDIDRDWKKIAAVAALGLVTAALIVLTVLSAVATCGVATPLASIIFALSLSSLGLTASTSILCSASVVSLGLMLTTGFFAEKSNKGSIASSGEVLETTADNIISEHKKKA